jgi:hypothetical protein
MATIITASTATLAAASTAASSASRALAKTAAIAIHALGLATPRSVPPTSPGASDRGPSAASGGALAMWYASQTM